MPILCEGVSNMLDILALVIAAHACVMVGIAIDLRSIRDQLANLDYDLMQLNGLHKNDTTN